MYFSESSSVLKAKVEQLESHIKKLEENEADFGVQRSKFRELFVQKEGW